MFLCFLPSSFTFPRYRDENEKNNNLCFWCIHVDQDASTAAMAGLFDTVQFSGHLAGHWSVSFADRRQTEDNGGIFNG